jgi:hypothetical protein
MDQYELWGRPFSYLAIPKMLKTRCRRKLRNVPAVLGGEKFCGILALNAELRNIFGAEQPIIHVEVHRASKND